MKGRYEHPFPLFRRPCVKLPVWTQAARRYWTGSLVPVCVALRLAVVWTQSVLRLRERSPKSLSLSGDHHVSKRGGEREKRGERRGLQQMQTMRFCGAFLPHTCSTQTHENMVMKMSEKDFSWFGSLFSIFNCFPDWRRSSLLCTLIANKYRDEIPNRNPKKTS